MFGLISILVNTTSTQSTQQSSQIQENPTIFRYPITQSPESNITIIGTKIGNIENGTGKIDLSLEVHNPKIQLEFGETKTSLDEPATVHASTNAKVINSDKTKVNVIGNITKMNEEQTLNMNVGVSQKL